MGRFRFYTMGILTVVLTTLALLPACGGGKPTSTITPVAAIKITHAIDVQAFQDCQICHATGTNGAKKNPDNHSAYTNKDCTICHKP